MNSRRRADLQRKLSMGAVPRPPDDLLARIKADIPQHLEAHPEPPRRFVSMTLFMRVAASLILLVTTGLVTWRVMESDDGPVPMVRDPRYFPAVERPDRDERAMQRAAAPAAATEEVRLEITEALPTPEAIVAQRSRPIVAATSSKEEDASSAVTRKEKPAAPQEDRAPARIAAIGTASTANDAPQAVRDEAEPKSREEDAGMAPQMAFRARPAPAPAAPPPPPSVTGAPTSAAAAESISVTASAPALDLSQQTTLARALSVPTAKATAPSDTLFGISVDPNAFATAREAIEQNEPLHADAIDVEAIVNYFAGDAPKPPRSGVRLEVELSPAPLAVPGDRAYLRFSVDTPRSATNANAAVARDIIVELDINEDVVSSWRQIGGDGSILREGQLPHNVAVTALYEMNLNAPLAASSRIATIELRYTSAADGSEERSSHTIRARDLIPQWTKASRRHRLATLGALWGEGLAGSAQAPEIAEKAQELAKQSPRDVRARELANAASATAGRY